MRLPGAYRSLARPSSASEPSHPPAGTVASNDDTVARQRRAQLTSGLHVHTVSLHTTVDCCGEFNPSHPRSHGVVHRSWLGFQLLPVPYKGHGFVRTPTEWTHWDSNPGHPPCKGGTLPLSYGPNLTELRQFVGAQSGTPTDRTGGPGRRPGPDR